MKVSQLPLEFGVDPSFAPDDFLVSPSNSDAWRFFEGWPNWPDRCVALVGPAGSGKSHLASIWAARSRAAVLNAADAGSAAVRCAFETGAALIEDADRTPWDEADLFHFLNRARAEQLYLVVTARTSPDLWGIATLDLLSRLRLSPNVQIGEPDEALIRSVLVKLIVDRQLQVDGSVLEFIALRLDRSLEAARRLVEELDREALARSRPVTRRMAADVLARMGAHGPAGAS